MNHHPYLRAYMAGVLLPTWVLLAALAVFTVAHFATVIPIPIERAMVFPMAVVPNLWGAWNALYQAIGPRRRWPIGLHGAVLPCILVPTGLALARALDVPFVTPARAALGFPVAVAVYYLAWKYVVAFFNRVVGIPPPRLPGPVRQPGSSPGPA